MRAEILALATFAILLAMWLKLGIRILSETSAIMEAAAAACMTCDGSEAVGPPSAVQARKQITIVRALN
jgi:hypothetical protein